MRLFIAEKPSMAGEIAKCLGTPIKKDGFFEVGNDIVVWAYGHILQQVDPAEYDTKYKQWKMEDLPIIPQEWKLNIAENCKAQFHVIKELVKVADEIINAGDPDREGQLLVDEVLDYLKNKKPVKRILLNALDEKSIKKALNNLRDNTEFLGLKNSALGRSRADWLIGMNLSRAYTLAAKQKGYNQVLAIGRVKTPTMSLVVRRELEIKDFRPTTHYQLKASFQHDNGNLTTIWKPKDIQPGLDSEGRIIDKEVIENLIQKMRDTSEIPKISEVEKTIKKENPPLPFSLSNLQIIAGKKFGYDPQKVLDTAQKLYEKKLTTYPRSDCDYLPESQFADAPAILKNLVDIADIDLSGWAEGTNHEIKSRAWNDKKITAHHAIIPTEAICKLDVLTEEERNLYYLIAQAYVAQFYPIHEYEQTKITINFTDEKFIVTGKVVKNDGWKSIYKKDKVESCEEDEEDNLPLVKKEDILKYLAGFAIEKITKPPTRFTTSTLLSAMKDIHKYVLNQDLKKQLKDVSGIGTEATRAGIIKELIDKNFIKEEKKYLYPSEISKMMFQILPKTITYPDTTAVWEEALNNLVINKGNLEDFLAEQIVIVSDLCAQTNQLNISISSDANLCPECKNIMNRIKGAYGFFWACSNSPVCIKKLPDKNGQPNFEKQLEVECPKCKKGIAKQYKGKSGSFWSCNDCKATFTDNNNVLSYTQCPKCKEGYLKQMKGIKGLFWACSNFPNCKNTYPDKNGKPDFTEKKTDKANKPSKSKYDIF